MTLVVLRRKGRIDLKNAMVVPAGPRKGGGHVFTLSTSSASAGETPSRKARSKYHIVCADETSCYGWIAAIKESIAAHNMSDIMAALSQAIAVTYSTSQPTAAQADGMQPPSPNISPPPRPASAPPSKASTPRRSASYETDLASLERKQRYPSARDSWAWRGWQTERSSRTSSDRQFEV